jgi:hypothetical protein
VGLPPDAGGGSDKQGWELLFELEHDDALLLPRPLTARGSQLLQVMREGVRSTAGGRLPLREGSVCILLFLQMSDGKLLETVLEKC